MKLKDIRRRSWGEEIFIYIYIKISFIFLRLEIEIYIYNSSIIIFSILLELIE